MLGVGELNADNVPREPRVGGGWGYADPVIAAIRRVIQDAAATTSPNFEPEGGYGTEYCARIARNRRFWMVGLLGIGIRISGGALSRSVSVNLYFAQSWIDVLPGISAVEGALQYTGGTDRPAR